MKYFLDTEFIESGPKKPIQLISIGIVSELGDTFYAISNEFNEKDASEWVRDNVLKQLDPNQPRLGLAEIAHGILHFVNKRLEFGKPEFWGYYADYDWVVFCQIFGTMMDLPRGFPMYCNDLKQWCKQLGDPQLPKQRDTEHNALNDAKWNQEVWDFLFNLVAERSIEKRK